MWKRVDPNIDEANVSAGDFYAGQKLVEWDYFNWLVASVDVAGAAGLQLKDDAIYWRSNFLVSKGDVMFCDLAFKICLLITVESPDSELHREAHQLLILQSSSDFFDAVLLFEPLQHTSGAFSSQC